MGKNTIEFPSPPSAQFTALLANSDAVTLDGGALITKWEVTPIRGDPHGEAVLFYWEDDGKLYACTLTESGVENGQMKDGAFVCENNHGDPTVVRFFKVRALSTDNRDEVDKAALGIHARRLIQQINRAKTLRQAGVAIGDADWEEIYRIGADVDAVLNRQN